jgi:protein NirF
MNANERKRMRAEVAGLRVNRRFLLFAVVATLTLPPLVAGAERGTGDLGILVERAAGSVQVIETTGNTSLKRLEGLGDLSHASAVFSRDGR